MDRLIELYVQAEMSVREVATIVNVPPMTVYRRLKKAGVLRNKQEAQRLATLQGKFNPLKG
jgi:transposase